MAITLLQRHAAVMTCASRSHVCYQSLTHPDVPCSALTPSCHSSALIMLRGCMLNECKMRAPSASAHPLRTVESSFQQCAKASTKNVSLDAPHVPKVAQCRHYRYPSRAAKPRPLFRTISVIFTAANAKRFKTFPRTFPRLRGIC